jgi:hypothetical protein
MTIMIVEVYDALKEAGASDEKASKAASTLAAYDNRLSSIERRLMLLQLQTGLLIAAVLAGFGSGGWLLLRVAAKVGAIG